MASKKQAIGLRPEAAGQRELMATLTEAGYKLDGFTCRGEMLVVRLTPASDFQALEVCAELGLQARCNVFAATPQDLLILSVRLPKAQSLKPKASLPKAQGLKPKASSERSD